MAKYISFDRMCGSGTLESFTDEICDIAENIADPNTDPEKARTLTIKLTFKPDKSRQGIKASVSMNSSLAPRLANETMFLLGKDIRTGRIEMRELGDDSQVISTQAKVVPVRAEVVPVAPEPRSFDAETGEIYDPANLDQKGPIDLRAVN